MLGTAVEVSGSFRCIRKVLASKPTRPRHAGPAVAGAPVRQSKREILIEIFARGLASALFANQRAVTTGELHAARSNGGYVVPKRVKPRCVCTA